MERQFLNRINEEYEKVKMALYLKGSVFLGALLCKMDFVWTEEVNTAATNGVSLFWNPKFFEALDFDTRVTVLAHELWHVAYMHMARIGNRNPEIHNIAADHVINLMLQEHGYYMRGFPYYMDIKYTGWSTEDIYDDLMKNPSPNNGSNKKSQLSGDIIPLPADKSIADVISKVVSAVTTAKMTNGAGDIPGEISLIIEQFLNPKLPWETLLYNFFNEITDFEFSYRRPNRRYSDPILPGMAGTTGLEHLIYYLDISGSVSDDNILRFNSEVKFIKDEFKPQKLTLVTFDTKIQDEYVFEEGDSFEKIIVTGRGGTSLFPVFEHAKKNNPTAMVIFTDLYVGIPMESPLVPLIWICIDNKTATVPYGKLIHLTNDRHVSEGVTNSDDFVEVEGSGISAN